MLGSEIEEGIEADSVSRSAFANLLAHIGLDISPFMPEGVETMASISSGSAISNETKLFCTLKWLGGGSYLDVTYAFGVSKASLEMVEEVLFADGVRHRLRLRNRNAIGRRPSIASSG